jgi:gliding motility-associated-like protein
VTTADTGSAFGGYFIYGSPSPNGPFSLYDSVKVHSLQTVTINGINANNFVFHFYIRTREGLGALSIPSDTLKSMRLISTPLSNELAKLIWNPIKNPFPSTSSGNFELYKEVNPGVFTWFRTTTDTTTIDTNFFCDRIVNYKVIMQDASGCQSVSSIDGERFRDTRGPSATKMDSVSIDFTTGDVSISWYPDSSADTQGYVIYQFNGVSYDSIGAVSGLNSLFFSYPSALSNSESNSEVFSVAAYDSCKNLSPVAVNHKTIHLKANLAKCEGLALLEWTPYLNLEGGLARYEIWYRENGGAFTQGGSTIPGILTYDFQMMSPGANYEFMVRAIGNSNKSSTSNLAALYADIFDKPDFLYVRYATVTGSSATVRVHADPNADTKSYHLYRGTSETGSFNEIDSSPYNPTGDLTFVDNGANADKAPVYYKVAARDSCGIEFFSQNTVSTIFLQAEGGNDYVSRLNWTVCSGWDGPVADYKVVRVYSGIITSEIAGQTSPDTLEFKEDVSNLSTPDGNFCYVIMSTETGPNQYGFSDISYSNIDCSPQEPIAFVPNAFTPGGLNPVFAPVIRFNNDSEYQMLIYNRWGQLVFETKSILEGWDGTQNGQDAQQGTYFYSIKSKGLNGNEIAKSGLLHLIR